MSMVCSIQKFGGGPRPLHTDVQGILITTGDKEKLCVSEAYNLLNEVRSSPCAPSSEKEQTSHQREIFYKVYLCVYFLYKITSKRGLPLYKGQNAGTQMCPLIEASTVRI